MAVDQFGITKLYGTKSGAREWFSNWHNSTSRAFRNAFGQQFEFPATSGQNQDPQDYQYFSMAGGPTAWFIDGQSGIATWRQEDDPPLLSAIPSCRPFIIDYPAGINGYDIKTQIPARETWNNVEMTCYVRAQRWGDPDATLGDNGSFVRLAARDNHFNISSCNCDGQGYSINLLGYSNHAYATLMHKEILHDIYGNPSDGVNVAQSAFPTIPSYSRFSNVQRFPLLRWVGIKFVCRTITSSGFVRLEGYRDLTNGHNGGDWLKLADLTDDGIDMHWGANLTNTRNALDALWASSGHCGNSGTTHCIETPVTGNYNPLITRAAYSCYIRIQNLYKVDLKKFSVREIDPL